VSSLAFASPARRKGIAERVDAIDWTEAEAHLDGHGFSTIERILTADECRAIAGLYDDDALSNRVVMARHGFPREYRLPLPAPGAHRQLRARIPARADARWNEAMHQRTRQHADSSSGAAEQDRPDRHRSSALRRGRLQRYCQDLATFSARQRFCSRAGEVSPAGFH
jgi:hypothetical protein